MPSEIVCPSCHQQVHADVAPGATIICPHCQTAIPPSGIPSVSPPTAAPDISYATFQTSGPPLKAGMAVASLVIGILGMFTCPLIGIVGLILGIIALVRANNQPRRYGGKGLAIGGICASGAGMVFSIAFSAMMISILLPSLARARELSKRTVCAANMQGIGVALMTYAEANDGAYPPDLDTLIDEGLISEGTLICPSTDDDTDSYEYDPEVAQSAAEDEPILKEYLDNHKGEGQNMLFGDGHVEFVPASGP